MATAFDRLFNGFMVPEIYLGEYWEVSANRGESHIVVCGTEEDVPDYIEGTIDRDDNDNPIIERKHGYLARMHAPGYCDCTDWCAHETEEDARACLVEMYSDDDNR